MKIPKYIYNLIDVYGDLEYGGPEQRKGFLRFGFEFVNKNSINGAYIGETHKWVIKKNFFAYKKPKKALPTFKYKGWKIQPRCSALSKKEKKAWDIISPYLEEIFGGDCHSENVGVHKGKLVAFDW